MKKLFTYLLMVLVFTGIIYSQDFQVSNTGTGSVESPVLDVYNGNVYLSNSSNHRFYKFPTNGSGLPINSPIVIGSNYAYNVTMEVNKTNGDVYSSFIEHTSTPTSKYLISYSQSQDAGATWPGHVSFDSVQTGNSLEGRNDSPIILSSDLGNIYNIWYVFNNKLNESALMINRFDGDIHRIDHLQNPGDIEKVISAAVVTTDNKDTIFVTYCVEDNGTNNFWLRRLSFNGNTINLDTPVLIKSIPNSEVSNFNNFIKLLVDSEKNLYFFYNYSNSEFESDGTYITKSTDGGTNWNTPVISFTDGSNWPPRLSLNITTDDKIVSVWNNGTVYVRSSKDGINWTADIPVSAVDAITNSYVDSKVIDNNNIAVTWLDTRTGNGEIFYSKTSIPDPDMVLSLDLTINLEGPYNGGEMSTAMEDSYVLPTNQPFNVSPWFYMGREKTGWFLPWSTIVDWVLVELRTGEDASSMVKQTAALVTKDGKIVGSDGLSPLKINFTPGDYYIVVYHRNHLPVMTSNLVHLEP